MRWNANNQDNIDAETDVDRESIHNVASAPTGIRDKVEYIDDKLIGPDVIDERSLYLRRWYGFRIADVTKTPQNTSDVNHQSVLQTMETSFLK